MKMFTSLRFMICVMLCHLVTPVCVALAQECSFAWKAGDPVPGVDGVVIAMTTWDFDGDGPQSEVLVVGGQFKVAGDVIANGIAIWDGKSWNPLGSGVGGSIHAVAIYNNELYVGGYFLTAGGKPANHIARWDGSSWHSLGDGVDSNVVSLFVFQNKLIVSGYFLSAGGLSVNRIATWDGEAWFAEYQSINGLAHTFTIDQGQLLAAGSFNYPSPLVGLKLWTGSDWISVGSIATAGAFIRCMTWHNGDLVIGGTFSNVMGFPAKRIARRVGSSWQPFGQGLNGDNAYGRAVTVYDGDLVIGGTFISVDGVGANYIAKWNGAVWEPLGDGLDYQVHCFATFRGELIVGGDFQMAGDRGARGIARWDGRKWRAFGDRLAAPVTSLIVYNGDLIAGGEFISGDGACKHIARWNQNSWEPIGVWVEGPVYAMTIYDDKLIAGGVNVLAAWDGKRWERMDREFQPWFMVTALAVFKGELHAAGFISAGGAAGLLKWTGSAWSGVGGGVSGTHSARVSCLHIHDDDKLIVGGEFKWAAGLLVNAIAQWNGSGWHALGSGLGSVGYPSVNALTSYRGELIAGGTFDTAGGVPCKNIARWDEKSWRPVAESMTGGGDVFAMVVYNGELIVGGRFATIDGVPAVNIARWDGEAWSALKDGLGGGWPGYPPVSVLALGTWNGDLVAGGRTTIAGDMASAYWARWGPPASCVIDIAPSCGDGIINVNDLLAVIIAWGPAQNSPADVNDDGIVNHVDLLAIIHSWGSCSK